MLPAERTQIRQNLNGRQAAIATLFGEARGESQAGRTGVMWVIMNRALHPAWWGRTVRDVCLQPWQFSCWWNDDPDRDLTYAFALALGSSTDPIVAELAAIVDGVLGGTIPDPTGGACYYDTTAYWNAKGKTDYPGAKVLTTLDHQTFFTI
jgi:spore germination cell wall hydrolase CwlJ-like protein